MGIFIGIFGLGLIAAIGYLLYLAVIIGGAVLLAGLFLIFGIYLALIDSFGPEVTWSIIVVTGVGIAGYLLHKNAQLERAEAARQAEEERLRAIAIETERQRRIALDTANKLATKTALAKPWHDRSLDDWKRILLD